MNQGTLLIVDDDSMFRNALTEELCSRGFVVSSAPNGSAALAWIAEHACDVMLLDLRLGDISGMDVLKAVREQQPDCEVVLFTGHGTIDNAIEAIRLGAFHYLTKPCPTEEVEVTLRKAQERRRLLERNSILNKGLAPPDMGEDFVGQSAKFKEVLHLIDRVAPTTSSVLVSGETGVGKELVAKLIHARSPRKDAPFVVVDCGILHENLLQSELFGHERGAFTGASRQKHGLFEVADGGTIFLDEIGDLSLSLQVQLLRVLETGAFRRVGGTSQISVDVRVIAATHRDLTKMVSSNLFREDLLYRLDTIKIEVPPLRERPADIACLVAHYLSRFNERFELDKVLAPEALDLLLAHPWNGNVRELLHVVEQVVVLSDGPVIGPEQLPSTFRAAPRRQLNRFTDEIVPLSEVERQYVTFVVSQYQGHREQAAKALGISERSLYRKIKEYSIE